jgi:signal transduction histidine kinase
MRRKFKRLRGLFSSKPPSVAQARRLHREIHDFAQGGITLFWQRQSIYAGAALLCGFYFSWPLAAFCYLLVQATDLFDTAICDRVINRTDHALRHTHRLHRRLTFSSALSSAAVGAFVLLLARIEGPGEHFMSLFFLFAAGLFAAVNNHQIRQILALRLVTYGAIFIYIPVADILAQQAPINSKLWLHFATALFVLYFVLECASIFLRMYQRTLDQMEDLRLERDKARAGFEQKSQFVSVVSDELRTPLTSIKGALSLLRETDLAKNPDSATHMLDIAHKNSERLDTLIKDLLDIQKMEARKMVYHFAPINVTELITEAAQAITPYADQRDIVVRTKPPSTPLWVRGDHERLMQVLHNLLSNAVKFSHTGGYVEVGACLEDGCARIEVRDFGIGIPPESSHLVFDLFQQVNTTDSRRFEGSGLGLPIAHQIAEDHGAALDFDSRLGEGSCFYAIFPLCDTEDDTSVELPKPPKAVASDGK